MKPRLVRLALFCAHCALGVSLVSTVRAQSNIVVNGGFEQGMMGWQSPNAVVWSPSFGSVEGTNYLLNWNGGGSAWQDLPTVAGRDYIVQFATPLQETPEVKWGSNSVVVVPDSQGGIRWRYWSCSVHAVEAVTRLTIAITPQLALDDVRVGWRDEPITFLSQPASITGLEGGTVSFAVRAQGGPPISYQWAFQGVPITGQTNSTFTLTGLRSMQAGTYSVLVSNSAGALWSDHAELNVHEPLTSPVFVLQPESVVSVAGYIGTLRTVAVGEQPLFYQWYRDGELIPDATNRSLTYSSLTTTNNGIYTVTASNIHGMVTSFPCAVTVSDAVGGGWLGLTNNTPIRDIDGTTPLSGPGFLAQMYLGVSPTLLRPVSSANSPAVFRTNNMAGFIVAPWFRIPDVVGGGTVYAQMRAWEAAAGSSYEEARATGGRFGFSDVRQLTAATRPGVIQLLPSFSLRPGLPFFYTGRLDHGPTLPDGTRQLVLSGETGFRFLVEQLVPPNAWEPLFIVTNSTGTVTFGIPDHGPSAVRMYRSRIVD